MSAWGQETILFDNLTPDLVLQAIEAQGYRCTGRLQPLNSMENRVYQVELDLGEGTEIRSKYERDRIIKFYRPGRWTKEQILEEHQFLKDLQDAEIPVVPPETLENGSTLNQLATTPLWYCIFPRVGGRVPDEFSKDQLQFLGRLLARLHICGEQRQAKHRIIIDHSSYGEAHLKYLVDQKTIPLDISRNYQQTVEQICAIASPWFKEAQNHRIHGDCHLGNLLWTDTGPFWVDFDDMLTGPAVQDIWLLTPGIDDYAVQQRKELLNAYSSIRKFDDKTLQLIEPLRALRYIHFSAWIKRRYKDRSFQRAFPGFDSWGYWQQQLEDMKEQLRRIKES